MQMFPLWSVVVALLGIERRIATADELLSARCHSKCLHDLEMRVSEDNDLKRHLKHHIVNLCKDEANCSSCAAPCREVFVDIESCRKNGCKDAKDVQSCQHSCEYLRQIYAEKPGMCPRTSEFIPSDECSAHCHLDGDCPEAQKCCTVGCSRQCLQPKSQDPRLLPVPTSITVQERKRKRSAVVRWVMQQMARHHTSTNSNLYVLQWRWSVHKEEQTMTEWQTIMVKNKVYAILKHLLAPGRYYTFRVAAVNMHGSLGFSKSSTPFKLSKEARAPGEPRDFTLGPALEDSNGLWSQKVLWTPPVSDLPIKNYVLSWQKSSAEQADAYEDFAKRRASLEQQGKRSAGHDDEDADPDDGFTDRDHVSTVLPSYSTSAEIEHLAPSSVYLLEVHASVDSTDGELHGEKAVIFVRTAPVSALSSGDVQLTSSSLRSSVPSQSTETPTVTPLEIQPPYFEDGVLKTAVSWLNSQHCSPLRRTFLVRWRLTTCQASEHQKRTFYDLDSSGEDWEEMKVTECVALIDELSFSCSYTVEVKASGTNELAASGEFRTESCSKTPSTQQIFCDEQHVEGESSVRCAAKQTSAECVWSSPTRWRPRSATLPRGALAVVGYRIALLGNGGAANTNVTITPPQTRRIRFVRLHAGSEYSVYVHSITSAGLGETLSTTFRTLLSTAEEAEHPDGELDRDAIESSDGRGDRFDTDLHRLPAAVVELPLEGGIAARLRWSLLTPLFAAFCLRLFLCEYFLQ